MRLVLRAKALIASTARAVEAIGFYRQVMGVRGIARQIPAFFGLRRPAPVSALSRGEILHALRYGCPVCVLETEAVRRFTFWFLNEYYGEAAWVDRLVRSLGFCRRHTWLLVTCDAPYKLSYVALYLAESLLRHPPAQWPKPAPCPLCLHLETMKAWWCRDIARLLLEPDFARQYEGGQGVCFAHFPMVYEQASEPAREVLLRVAAANSASAARHNITAGINCRERT